MTHVTRSGATVRGMPGDGASYAIRVRGRLSDAVLSLFDGMASDVAGGDTVLRGPVADQVQLHRLLDLIRSLGLELIELRRTPPVESST
jgi:hypothetical protein